MKIGILTLPLHINYGGILQAYALQTILKRMGHETFLIEKQKKSLRLPLWKAPFAYSKRILKNILGHPFPIFYEQKYNKKIIIDSIIGQYTHSFINKYITRNLVNDFLDIQKEEYDAIVVGSDQIWRPKYFPEIGHAYLDFAEDWNIKRIAYAASFGTEEWEYTTKQTIKCKRLIKHFDAVSIRETTGVNLCHKYFDTTATNVLDPTLLLTKEDYIELFKKSNTTQSPGTLLSYILDETHTKIAFINKIAKEKNLIPFEVNPYGKKNAPLEERIQLPVEQWIRGFYDAEFIITDSFHACVFSIIFNKPFVIIGNPERGLSRFTSLLSILNLNNRLIMDTSTYQQYTDINWNNVNLILKERKKTAVDFLTKHLNN